MNEYFVKEELKKNLDAMVSMLQADRTTEAAIAFVKMNQVIEDLPDGLKGIEREKKLKETVNNVIPIRTIVLEGVE